MIELPEFEPNWSDYRKALYYDAHGDWDKAHTIVDGLKDPKAMHIHAYLHRKEGDQWNASYWYSRANQPVYTGSVVEEWQRLWSLYR